MERGWSSLSIWRERDGGKSKPSFLLPWAANAPATVILKHCPAHGTMLDTAQEDL